MGFLFDDLCCCFSNSELQELSAAVLERIKSYYNTSRDDHMAWGLGGYTYLLLVGTLEGGGTLAHLDQAVGMGSYPIAGLRHRVKLLFYLCNIF